MHHSGSHKIYTDDGDDLTEIVSDNSTLMTPDIQHSNVIEGNYFHWLTNENELISLKNRIKSTIMNRCASCLRSKSQNDEEMKNAILRRLKRVEREVKKVSEQLANLKTSRTCFMDKCKFLEGSDVEDYGNEQRTDISYETTTESVSSDVVSKEESDGLNDLCELCELERLNAEAMSEEIVMENQKKYDEKQIDKEMKSKGSIMKKFLSKIKSGKVKDSKKKELNSSKIKEFNEEAENTNIEIQIYNRKTNEMREPKTNIVDLCEKRIVEVKPKINEIEEQGKQVMKSRDDVNEDKSCGRVNEGVRPDETCQNSDNKVRSCYQEPRKSYSNCYELCKDECQQESSNFMVLETSHGDSMLIRDDSVKVDRETCGEDVPGEGKVDVKPEENCEGMEGNGKVVNGVRTVKEKSGKSVIISENINKVKGKLVNNKRQVMKEMTPTKENCGKDGKAMGDKENVEEQIANNIQPDNEERSAIKDTAGIEKPLVEEQIKEAPQVKGKKKNDYKQKKVNCEIISNEENSIKGEIQKQLLEQKTEEKEISRAQMIKKTVSKQEKVSCEIIDNKENSMKRKTTENEKSLVEERIEEKESSLVQEKEKDCQKQAKSLCEITSNNENSMKGESNKIENPSAVDGIEGKVEETPIKIRKPRKIYYDDEQPYIIKKEIPTPRVKKINIK